MKSGLEITIKVIHTTLDPETQNYSRNQVKLYFSRSSMRKIEICESLIWKKKLMVRANNIPRSVKTCKRVTILTSGFGSLYGSNSYSSFVQGEANYSFCKH